MKKIIYWEKVVDKLRDKRFAVDTGGSIPISFKGAYQYSTIPYRMIDKILGKLELQSSDVFVDLGCGKGRALCCAAQYPMKEILGVEVDEHLYQIAKENIERLKCRQTPVHVIHCPAQENDYPHGTLFWLFKPFDLDTLKEVLSKIKKSVEANPRSVRIVYINIAADQELYLDQTGWLHLSRKWDKNKRKKLYHSVSVYTLNRTTGAF